ncbi:MAG: hypothetical protein HUJ27_07555 [Rhodobacteraceae bacterium]|nr:hypothetical protein [Paracoccaceae bacterium]
MLKFAKSFRDSEDGAVTVDWVVLVAGICFLGIAVVQSVSRSTVGQSDSIGAWLASVTVDTEGASSN